MAVEGDGLTPQSASSQAITALVLGILGLGPCCGLILAPLACYLGSQEQKAIQEGRAPAAGKLLAVWAVLLGIPGLIVQAGFLFWIFFRDGLADLSAFLGR